MLQIASSQGLLQSLFCSCLNPLSALTVTETQMTKTSDSLAQNRTALPSSYSERTAWRGSQGRAGWTVGWGGSRASSKQVLEWGCSESTGGRLKSAPPSPQALLALQGGHLPCVCRTRGQTGTHSRCLCPQRMHSRCLGWCPCPCPQAPATGHAVHCHTSGEGWLRGEQDEDVALSSWCGEGSSPGSLCTQVCAARAAIAAVHQHTLSWGVDGAEQRKGSLTEGFAAPSQGIQVPFFSVSDFPNAPPCSEEAAWEFNSFKTVSKSNS